MKKSFSRVFIKDTSGAILVIKHKNTKWNLPGGKQEIGETAVDCAIREVQEEIALEVSDLEEIYFDNFIFNDVAWQGSFYFANTVAGQLTLNEPEKITEIQFVNELEPTAFSLSLSPMFSYLSENNILSMKITKWL